MEFKVGDKVRFINNEKGRIPSNYQSDSYYIDPSILKHGVTQWDEEDCIIRGIRNGRVAVEHYYKGETMCLAYRPEDLELVSRAEDSTIQKGTMTEKKVYEVLVVNTKTSQVETTTQVAVNEQQAILKAFNVKNVEDLQISTTEKAKFTEQKPQEVVMKAEGKKAE